MHKFKRFSKTSRDKVQQANFRLLFFASSNEYVCIYNIPLMNDYFYIVIK